MTRARRWTAQCVVLVLVSGLSGIASAEQSVLVLQVSSWDERPLKGVVLATKGDGRKGPPTDDAGKTRIGLAPATKPSHQVTLMIVQTPENKPWRFVSPKDGNVRVPPFENESNNFVSVWLTEPGNNAALGSIPVLTEVTKQITNAIPGERVSRRESAEDARSRILGERAHALGLQPADVENAIRSLGQRSTSPYQQGLTALYEQRYADATRYLRASTQMVDRDLADRYVSLGWAEYQERHYPLAAEAFRKALRLRPDDSDALEALALVYRSLHDFQKARVVMEQAVALGAATSSTLYNLAIMQKNDARIDLALKSLERASSATTNTRESANIELVIAGYLIYANRRNEGLRRFETLKPRLVPADIFAINLAWFYAVADRKQDFYVALERALMLRPGETLVWIDQEVDIDKYRDEARFKELLTRYQKP